MVRFCRDVADGFGGYCNFVDVVDVLSSKMESFEKERYIKSVGGPSHPVLLQLELHRRACMCVYWVR
jgi:hypothetical protein